MTLQRIRRSLNRRLGNLTRSARQRLIERRLKQSRLILVTEGAGWVLDDFSESILSTLPSTLKGRVIDFIPAGLSGKVIHFVERYQFFSGAVWADGMARKNSLIVTWWHGGAGPVQHIHLDEPLFQIPAMADEPVQFHITSTLYRSVLLSRGVPENRITYLPMGVHSGRFHQLQARPAYKEGQGLPTKRFVIGSFQRDGDEEPKLVKGPDVLLQVVEKLRDVRDDLFVYLAGPKRGYVIRHLERMGIPYLYQGWVSYKEMAPLYFACDAYLIASREEGGPAAVLECMATGTPLVSTRVGMAVDVIRHGENGFLAEIEDVDSLAGHLLELMENPGQRDRISSTALETAPRYDWSVVGPRYGQELYEPALANLHRT